jgi:hypothetical protein
MTRRRFGSGGRWLVALLVAAGLTGRRGEAQASDSEHLRPASVTVTIENDRLYSGTYTATGVATVCGKVTLGFPNRENAFTVEFPDEETPQVRTLSFDAESLRPGTSTARFHLAVGVRIGERGAPPQYVVRADEPRFNEPGTASLIDEKGSTTLSVTGTAALGVVVRAKITCNAKR